MEGRGGGGGVEGRGWEITFLKLKSLMYYSSSDFSWGFACVFFVFIIGGVLCMFFVFITVGCHKLNVT